MIGPFGEHPSRICGKVSFGIQFKNSPGKQAEALVRDCLDSGLAGYVGLYGDKTKVTDLATGQPMVAQHYDLRRVGDGFEITVHGATGHMGAIRERDGAITKMAQLVRSLVYSRAKLETTAGRMRLELGNNVGQASRLPGERDRANKEKRDFPALASLAGAGETADLLSLEGGQGFVPTHSIEEVMARMRGAAERGAENYLRRCGRNETGARVVTVTYEKLHNAAFDGDPDSLAMRNAIAAAKISGLWKKEPVSGWTVSCDARLFAVEYPGMPVLTFGPGELAFAHSDSEQIGLKDIVKAVEFLALFLLHQTGTI